MAENEEDEMECEDNMGTFLESPIFLDVVENIKTKNAKPSENDILKAVIHYLEKDDFMY